MPHTESSIDAWTDDPSTSSAPVAEPPLSFHDEMLGRWVTRIKDKMRTENTVAVAFVRGQDYKEEEQDWIQKRLCPYLAAKTEFLGTVHAKKVDSTTLEHMFRVCLKS